MIRSGSIPPIYAEIPFTSPAIIYDHLLSADSYLFESVKGPENIARYSFIGFDPCLVFRARDGLISLQTNSEQTILTQNPLAALKNITGCYRQSPHAHLPPFQGGFAGMFSYDFVHYLEKLPSTTRDDLHIPDAHFLLTDKLISFDHTEKRCWIVICPGLKTSAVQEEMHDALDGKRIYEEAEDAVRNIRERVSAKHSRARRGSMATSNPRAKPRGKIEIKRDMRKREYLDMVKRAKEYIGAGDIFQANLSQRFSACNLQMRPWELYRTLRTINPSPFAGFVDFGDYQIVSSSPERLLRIKDGRIETRPIAGTRPRGRNRREDVLMRAELLLNEKERAEHIMLIDLERNDLGRVSAYGTVHVDELMITEDYSHVMHIVSNIAGRLMNGKDCFDAIGATFPGGTITGVPKVRCMEIIDELEPVRRGPYTGSMGYIGLSGALDFNIIIRTFVIKGGSAYVQAGAGIVADSDPEREYGESVKKAEALLKTLEMLSVIKR